MYQEKLHQLKNWGLLGLLLGLALGIILCVSIGEIDVLALIVMAIYFAGTPYGWVTFGKVFNFIIIGPIPFMIIGFALRLICAVVLGWIVYPVVLIYTFIRAKREGK